MAELQQSEELKEDNTQPQERLNTEHLDEHHPASKLIKNARLHLPTPATPQREDVGDKTNNLAQVAKGEEDGSDKKETTISEGSSPTIEEETERSKDNICLTDHKNPYEHEEKSQSNEESPKSSKGSPDSKKKETEERLPKLPDETGDSVTDGSSLKTKPEVEDDSSSEPAPPKEEKEEHCDLSTTTEDEDEEHTVRRQEFVETIGASPLEDAESETPDLKERLKSLLLPLIVVILAVSVWHHLQQEPAHQKKSMRPADIFLKQMESVKVQFPKQRVELWSRSTIHLKKHLQAPQPTEPVSLILTAGVQAERTLGCLAQRLASAFSNAVNASVLHIDGAGAASRDSDNVKLEIDRQLQSGFEGNQPVAVIHRFEELPPGSTLIFYRYCDHENAAYKKIFMIFTVLLEDEEEIPVTVQLSDVEEMVDDHLQRKFLSHRHPVSFDRMDIDKYGGLWSRISHLILPVVAEESVEQFGCNTPT